MRYFIPLLALVVLLSGCAGINAPIVPPPGAVYTNFRAPLQVDYSGKEIGSRKGTSTVEYLQVPFTYGLLSFSWGDASIKAATRDGGIASVTSADYEYMSVLGIYARMTSIVYGEPAATP